jgi:peptidyl-prolyl cis-trans isomerase D
MPPQNKKFLAQKEREDRQKKIIIITTITVLVLVFGLIIYGVLDKYVLQPKTPIVELGSQSLYADEFDQQVRWTRRNLILQVDQILLTFQQLGGSPELAVYFEGQLNMLLAQLDEPLAIGQEVLQNVINDLIVQEEAERLGIEVSSEEIDIELQNAFGYFPAGTPTSEPTTEPAPTSTLTSLQKTLVPPTPTQIEVEEEGTILPTNTPEVEPTASTADDGEPDPTATPLLVPTEYTRELFDANFQEFLSTIKNDGIKKETVMYIVRLALLRQKVFDVITADVERTQDHVWVRHILVEDELTAKVIADKISAGEDFSALAAEFSIDTGNKDQGGDLGWFTYGQMVPPFEEAAFQLEVGEISQPVETDFGWHIIQSLGKEKRALSDSTYDQLKGEAYMTWLDEKRIEYEPNINEDWQSYTPNDPSLPPQYDSIIQTLFEEEPAVPVETPQE